MKEQLELYFLSKPRQELTATDPIYFNGAIVKLNPIDMSISIIQLRQIKKIELVKNADDYIA